MGRSEQEARKGPASTKYGKEKKRYEAGEREQRGQEKEDVTDYLRIVHTSHRQGRMWDTADQQTS
jgi:hypothetical protein